MLKYDPLARTSLNSQSCWKFHSKQKWGSVMKVQVSLFVASSFVLFIINHGVAAINPKIHMMTEAIDDSFIVVFKKKNVFSLSSEEMASALSAANTNVTVTHVFDLAIQGFAAQMTLEDAEALAESDEVDYIEQDQIVNASESVTWGLDRVDQRDLPLDLGFSPLVDGSGVTAYIIDTGIRITHNEFGGRASWGANTYDSRDEDCNGHGTHVAGTVGGSVYGVAKNVDLVAVKTLSCYGSGTTRTVIKGIEWVIANAKKPATANLSLGGGLSQSLNTAANNMHNAGIVTVVASGNNNGDACEQSPGSAKNVICVGATEKNDSRAWFSSWGECVDILAPGVDITSAWITDDSKLHTISGTSMATPHVCGGAAMLLSAGIAPADVDDELIKMASKGKLSDLKNSPDLLLYVGGEINSQCIDSPTEIAIKNKGSITCSQLTRTQCQREKFSQHCPVTCNACTKFMCEDSQARFWYKGGKKRFKCKTFKRMRSNQIERRCKNTEIGETCRKTCNFCDL